MFLLYNVPCTTHYLTKKEQTEPNIPLLWQISFPVRMILPNISVIIFVFTIQRSHLFLLVSSLITNLLMQILAFAPFAFKVHSITGLVCYCQSPCLFTLIFLVLIKGLIMPPTASQVSNLD